jgi:uncharacterized protein (TIGR02271 family)
VALFENETSARNAIDALTQAGFNRDEVHLSAAGDYTGGASAVDARAQTTQPHGEGFLGWLRSVFGGDDYTTDDTVIYDEAARRGGYIVAVRADEDQSYRAADILNQYGAVDVDEHAARHGYAGSAREGYTRPETETKAIPVVKEELRIGKRAVQRGGVRVFSHVVEEPVNEEVRLREEKVRVERRPVDRPVTDADRAVMRDQTIEVTEMAEEPVIEKQARVVEEVRVGKDVRETKKTVSDKVRRTEVKTENIGTTTSAGDYTDDFRRDFQTRYGTSGATYETYAPAYDYGYRMANETRYKGRSWADVESDLKADYVRRNPGSTWEKVKDSVRYGWYKVTGQR